MEPRIQYARTLDGANIAYCAIGDGPPLVYLHWGCLGHLAREWQYPEQRHWCERLAAHRRVIRLDHRGTGLSDRDLGFSLESAAHDIEAVVRKEGLTRFALMGQLHSAAAAILYTCEHPETVSHLVLWTPFASYRDFVESSPPLQAARAAAGKDWQTFTELLAQLATGWAETDQARRFAAYLRECATVEQEERPITPRVPAIDLTKRLAQLTMPVLVLHRREAAFPAIEVVKKLTADTPRARLVLLEGSAIVPFLGDTDTIFAAIEDFLTESGEQDRPDGLTERELQILALLANGRSTKAIADTLSISSRTVERHIGNIYLKIGVHNRAEATAYAFRLKITPRS